MLARGGPRPDPEGGTLTRVFFDAIERFDKPDALRVRGPSGGWQPISHRTVLDRVRRIALGLESLGIRRGDRVAILSENRPEWAIADYACLAMGVVDVPIYPSNPAEQLPYLLNDSGAVAIFASTATQAEKVASIRGETPGLRHVIALDDDARAHADLTLSELEARGASCDTPERAKAFREETLRTRPGDLATIIYTSGTTGEPKGVMLSHDNIHSNVMAAQSAVQLKPEDSAISFLPLSHIFERMADYLFFSAGISIAYVPTIDLVATAMTEVRPTFCMSVPRLYEKMYARVLESALAGGALKKRIFFWARSVADQYADDRLAGLDPSGLLRLQFAIADKLVFSKLRERTGGRMRYFVSGGAPLAPEINKFFYSAGLVILEGYGLTETSPVIAVNTPQAFRIGTVGKPVDGVEVMIAPDGEILTRGPHVMLGYYNKPDATREAIDPEGWFHTGDIGVIEDDFLRITDRKKDIIVTAGGKNIAPQPIENRIKTNQYVSQAVMMGDKRKYPIMLVVPNWDNLEKWARQKQITWTERSELLQHPEIRAKMEQEAKESFEGLASFETPKKIGLLEHDFSVESGELTPTLKVKRRVIDRNYKTLIDSLYAEGSGKKPEG